MTANLKNLERITKKILRGESATPADFEFHRRGLAREGNRALISQLNRAKGWEAFIRWSRGFPEMIAPLQEISEQPGVPSDAVQSFRSAGFISSGEPNANRERASEIFRLIEEGNIAREQSTFYALSKDPELLDGVLLLLEGSDSSNALSFLRTLLEQKLQRDQDREARKILYRLRQKGVQTELTLGDTSAERELFSMGENRLPLSQLIYYFRSHSAAGGTGDLYSLSIHEGEEFDFVQQARNLEISRSKMNELSNQGAERIREQYGIELKFNLAPLAHARFFLQLSGQELEGTRTYSRYADFLRFIGTGAIEDPFADLTGQNAEALSNLEATELLTSHYFNAWIIPYENMPGLFSEIEKVKQGPIILPPLQTKQRENILLREWMHTYFSERNRRIWSIAFLKAAYFQRTDLRMRLLAWKASQNFKDSQSEMDQLPIAAMLLDRTLQSYQEHQKKEQQEAKRSSLIVSPEEFQRSMQRKK
jgi:hypothetical protein